MSMIEIAAVILTAVSVYLAGRQQWLTWPTGMVSVVLFGILFWDKHLYAAAVLQVIYLVQSVWGWWMWSQPKERVTRLGSEDMCRCIDMLIWGSGLAYILLVPCGSPSPFLDGATFCLSLFATYLLTYRYVETWLVWMVTNVLYAILFTVQGLPLTALLSVGLLLLNANALRSWKRELV